MKTLIATAMLMTICTVGWAMDDCWERCRINGSFNSCLDTCFLVNKAEWAINSKPEFYDPLLITNIGSVGVGKQTVISEKAKD